MPARLSRLSDDRLLSRLDELVVRERRVTLCIIDHLIEVERRELFLGLGHGSMFSYCTERLRYSASAASRRIRTARCIRSFPVVRAWLRDRRVNLTTLSMVAAIMTDENHVELLSRIAGRTQREVDVLVAEYQPPVAVRDQVKPVRVVAATPSPSTPAQNRTLGCEYDRNGRKATPVCDSRNGARGDVAPVTGGGPAPPVANESDKGVTQVVVRFAAPPELKQQIEAARALLSFRLPASASLADILGAVLGDFIDRNDPAKRRERRRERRVARGAKKQERSGEQSENPRMIPAAVRDDVLADAGGRCEYVSDSGRRCDATTHLQIDHIVPVAHGGTAERKNLRVLCGKHNRSEARRILG